MQSLLQQSATPTVLRFSCKLFFSNSSSALTAHRSCALSTAAEMTMDAPTTSGRIFEETETYRKYEHVRAALMRAVSRGRSRLPQPQVKVCAVHNRGIVKEGLTVEDLMCLSEEGGSSSQAWVPLRIIHAQEPPMQRLPVVIFMHATGASMRNEQAKQETYAAAGYLTVALDSRYHGERAGPSLAEAREGYQRAIVEAWQGSNERPFLLDKVWDLLHLLDYLVTREDVDPSRIGMTGTSLGGMQAWLAAVIDPRIAVLAPMIGVQNFQWAIDHNQFAGRVESIPLVFQVAATELGKDSVDGEVVAAVWRKILPGLLEHYDAPFSLPALAPRPLLIANGELDHRTPLPGVLEAYQAAQPAYAAAIKEEQPALSVEAVAEAVAQRLRLYLEPGSGHRETPGLNAVIRAFFDEHLLGKMDTI